MTAGDVASKVDVALLRAVDVLGVSEMLRDQRIFACGIVAATDLEYAAVRVRGVSGFVVAF